ncbi:tetratricopeptide repeat-containing sensor histidine kinase [Spirosoma oryzicola]|uniref:tetratricopeptide repeat-containing sensor histidine kinase n=1 Tax=Spirosoma oryzicola TaxID=2898794 RepID=UPI001E453570|nr:tetratricopeptide repeat protein [Spirosoma oryzicola]UHG93949.1 tetratricopeptide repeat protein [Spirosoma oryzicola]
MMTGRNLSFTLAGLLVSFSCLAQVLSSTTSDSLLTYLRTHASTDTTYVRVMDKVIYTRIYQKADYARADSMSRQMADVANRLNDWFGVVRAYRNRGMVSYLTANYEQALGHFKKTLDVAEQHNLPPSVIYGALSNVAVGYEKVGNDPMVLQTALKAIQLQEQYNLRPRVPTTHRLVGGTLVKLGKIQQALPYYREAGVIFRENGDLRGIAIFENQLGDLYNDIKQPQRALPHFQECLKLGKQLHFELLQFDALDGLATSLRMLNKPGEGLPYAQRALQIAQKEHNKLAISTIYATIATLYQAKKEYIQAEDYLKKALALAEENDYKDERKKFVQQMADLYGEQNKYHLAYAFQLRKNKQVDSATTVRTNAEVQRLVAKYETEKKEAQIKLLQQETLLRRQEAERTRFMLIGSVLLLLLGVAASAWLLNRSKLRRLEEAQTLRKQIAHDLHDEVGSTLSSISLLSGMVNGLIAQNRPEQVERAIQKINTDARQILESIDEIIWTINPGNDSLHRIALRLQEYAQPLMESKGIEFRFTVDASLDQFPVPMEVRRNLYLIGKEAINNLIKYSQATQAVLRFEYQNEQLKILIEDNGKGFEPDPSSQRTGQTSMHQRAQAIGGHLAVQSAPGQGTRLQLVVNP